MEHADRMSFPSMAVTGDLNFAIGLGDEKNFTYLPYEMKLAILPQLNMYVTSIKSPLVETRNNKS